jgi:hypothetical protein
MQYIGRCRGIPWHYSALLGNSVIVFCVWPGSATSPKFSERPQLQLTNCSVARLTSSRVSASFSYRKGKLSQPQGGAAPMEFLHGQHGRRRGDHGPYIGSKSAMVKAGLLILQLGPGVQNLAFVQYHRSSRTSKVLYLENL